MEIPSTKNIAESSGDICIGSLAVKVSKPAWMSPKLLGRRIFSMVHLISKCIGPGEYYPLLTNQKLHLLLTQTTYTTQPIQEELVSENEYL